MSLGIQRPLCAVRGLLHGGRAVCGSVINASKCGLDGECEHQQMVESDRRQDKAAQRDASFHANPNTSSPKRYHIIRDGFPACGLRQLLCVEDAIDVGDVQDNQRCTRNGCRQHWPSAGGDHG